MIYRMTDGQLSSYGEYACIAVTLSSLLLRYYATVFSRPYSELLQPSAIQNYAAK